MFNLDFSGLFGGGGFALDTSKFNFDAYKAPEAKKEVVVDPVDVVSDKSPTPDVEVLEGAGTVAVTKPDPITQAIEALKGKDLSNDFNVNPIASAPITPTPVATQPVIPTPVAPTPVAPTPDPIAEAIQTVKPLEMPSLSGLGGISGFDVTNKSVDNMLSEAETNKTILNPLIADIDKFNVGAGQAGLINTTTADDLKKYVGTSEFSNIVDQYSQARVGEQTGGWDGMASREVLNALGIPHSFETQDEFGRTSVYNFDEQTNNFELVNEYGGTTKENEIIKTVSQAAATAALTAGIGTSLSSSFAISSTAGQAIAAGAVSAAQGNDLEEVIISAATAGLAEEVKAAQTAAEAVDATKDVIAYADTISAIESGVDIVKAVDNGDVLGAISSTLDLTGNGSPASYIKDALGTTDAQTAGILKVIDKQLQGESLDDSVKSGAAAWIKEGGIKELDLDMDFGDGDWETPEAIKAIGDKLVEGASWANENFIKPVVNTVETLGAGAIEAASQANQFVQREVIDEVQVLMSEQNQTFQAAIEPIKEEFSKLNQSVRTDLANFDKEYLQPVKEEISVINQNVRNELALFDDETLQPIKEDIENVITKVDTTLSAFNQDYIKPIDEKLSQTNKDVRDQLATFDKDYLQPIKQDLSDTNKAFQQDIDEIQLALSEQNQSFREGLSGFEDTYLNPVKEDVKALAGDLKTGLSDSNQYVRDQLSGFEDDYLDPIKDDIETMAGNLKDGLSDTNQYVRDQLSSFDDDVLQPIKGQIESAIESISGLDVDMGGVQDMLGSLWDSINGLNTGLAATQEKFGRPSADKSPLVKMRTQYGEQYEFEDLRNNPLLNNELFS